jgi:hypothetical protein
VSGMKNTTIRQVLNRKIAGWLDTIHDDDVKKLASENLIVSGGAIPSMVMGEEVNDYDFYFRTIDAAEAVAKYYVNVFNIEGGFLKKTFSVNYRPFVKKETRENCKGENEERVIIYMKSAGVAAESQEEYKYFEGAPERAADDFVETLRIDQAEELAEVVKKPYRPVFLSENAVTLSGKIQLIMRFYGTPSEIHRNFDFQHAMCWYDYHTNTLEIPFESMRCMLSKELKYQGSLYPLASVFRIRKFIARGWRITAGQLLKMCFQISEMDLTDRETLREQLIGVDQAYMTQLLRELDKCGKIDSTYIAKLIDEVFK